jgi:hypothetical protein
LDARIPATTAFVMSCHSISALTPTPAGARTAVVRLSVHHSILNRILESTPGFRSSFVGKDAVLMLALFSYFYGYAFASVYIQR